MSDRPAIPQAIPAALQARIHEWCTAWGLPDLPSDLEISFSKRMTSSLGRCRPTEGRIRLTARLRDVPPRFLEEVLCHELAHVAVYRLSGRGVRPHGREWAELMRIAGYEPNARVPVEWLEEAGLAEEWAASRRRRLRFEHRCRACDARRLARRRMRAWRCGRCLKAGRPGRLEISELEPAPTPTS